MIARTIQAPCAAVWGAWENPEKLKEWWCPTPWTTEVRGFEFCSGGVFDVVMRGPDGEQEASPGVFLEVIPMERIVFTSVLSEGWRPIKEPFLAMTAIITMRADDEVTHYQARVLHPDKATRDRHEEMGFYQGWGICLNQLEELVQSMAVT